MKTRGLELVGAVLIAGWAVAAPAEAAIIAREDFDGGALNLLTSGQNPGDFSGSGDMFGVRTVGADSFPSAITDGSLAGSPSDNIGIVGQANLGNGIFGIADLKNTENPGGTGTAFWEFDISGAFNLGLGIDVGAMGDFEASDQFSFSYSIDGGSNISLFEFLADTSIAHTYKSLDGGAVTTLEDPLLEQGSSRILDKSDPTSGQLQTFTTAIRGTGRVLRLQLSAATNGGDEAFAFDNIVINGEKSISTAVVPEPSAIMGLAAIACIRAFTRRKFT